VGLVLEPRFERNAPAQAGKGQRQMVLALINTAFAQETAEAASGQWDVVADQLASKFPKLAIMLGDAKHDVLEFMSFPESASHTDRIDEPTRAGPRGDQAAPTSSASFPTTRRSCASSAHSYSNRTDEWQLQRRYIQLEGLQTVSDYGLHRISAGAK